MAESGDPQGPRYAQPIGSLVDVMRKQLPEAWESYSRIMDVLTSKSNKLNKEQNTIMSSEVSCLFANLKSLLEDNMRLKEELSRRDSGPPTYASKLKAQGQAPKPRPRERSKTPKRRSEEVLLVFPKEGETKNSAAVQKMVTEAVCPSSLKVKVKSVRQIKNGGIKITCDNKEDLGTIKQVVSEKCEKVESVLPKKRRPRVVIYDVLKDLGPEEVKDALLKQNNILEEEDLKFLFRMKARNQENCHWVAEVSPHVFSLLNKKRRLYFEWTVLNVKEYIRETRCYNCNLFGHIARVCKNPKTCAKCAEEGHEHKDCSKTPKCVNCTIAVQKGNKKINPNHASRDPKCPSLEREIELIRSRTNYGP